MGFEQERRLRGARNGVPREAGGRIAVVNRGNVNSNGNGRNFISPGGGDVMDAPSAAAVPRARGGEIGALPRATGEGAEGFGAPPSAAASDGRPARLAARLGELEAKLNAGGAGSGGGGGGGCVSPCYSGFGSVVGRVGDARGALSAEEGDAQVRAATKQYFVRVP